MNGLRHYIADWKTIRKNPFLSARQRRRLLGAYIKIRLKRAALGRLPGVNARHTKVLGFCVEHEDFGDFFWTFKDNFVDYSYYFNTNKTQPVIVDCGGNIGITTLLYKFLYPKSSITVFEPNPTNLKILKKNIENNNLSEVTVVPNAVAKEVKEINLYGTGRAVTMDNSLYKKEHETKEEYNSDERATVQTTLLSKYITSAVDCLKLDIEGAETEVLQELEETGSLSKINHIALEYHEFGSQDFTPATIIGLFERNGYVVRCDYGDFSLTQMAESEYYHFMMAAAKRST